MKSIFAIECWNWIAFRHWILTWINFFAVNWISISIELWFELIFFLFYHLKYFFLYIYLKHISWVLNIEMKLNEETATNSDSLLCPNTEGSRWSWTVHRVRTAASSPVWRVRPKPANTKTQRTTSARKSYVVYQTQSSS